MQYPLMVLQGYDGYHFNIDMINPLNDEETTKKVSSMNYYAYHLMIRQNADNCLLRFRRLLKQYCVDMYVKIETECLFPFPIFERHPTVVHLAVHLKNGQRVYFITSNIAQRAETSPATTLTSFLAICQSDQFARTLLFSEMPRYYTWNSSSKKFQRRKQGDSVPGHPDVRSTDALRRIHAVHPKNDECFYLRLLLVNVCGPTSFESLRTVNGIVCPTFRAACQELNLLKHTDNV